MAKANLKIDKMKKKIEQKREELNEMFKKDENNDAILKTSIELDNLINEYYGLRDK